MPPSPVTATRSALVDMASELDRLPLEQRPQLGGLHPLAVGVAGILEMLGHRPPARLAQVALAVPPVRRRLDRVVAPELGGVDRVVRGDHDLVQLLAGADADDAGAAL